jgi:hypothetical protein
MRLNDTINAQIKTVGGKVLSVIIIAVGTYFVYGWRNMPLWASAWIAVEVISAVVTWLLAMRVEGERRDNSLARSQSALIEGSYNESLGCLVGISLLGWTFGFWIVILGLFGSKIRSMI